MDWPSGLGSQEAEQLIGLKRDPLRDVLSLGGILGPHVPDLTCAGQEPRPNRKVVSLMWQDVWVTVGDDESGCMPILQGLAGFARPAEVLAIMGLSGCGKSSLLDALAWRLDCKRRQSGQILVNGRREPLAYGTTVSKLFSCFVTKFMENLRVDLSKYFPSSGLCDARRCANVNPHRERGSLLLGSAAAARHHAAIGEEAEGRGHHQGYGPPRPGGHQDRELGEQGPEQWAVGVPVPGSRFYPGTMLSPNGQRRRVSICMEILTRPKLLFLDEPTSGLDNAMSYYVMRRNFGLAEQHDMTVLASIHQPSSEVFGLFHNLCLLSQGRTLSFVPLSKAPEV
ncbi:tRNA:m(4)X modification enzyme TRM13 [Psidium guajava]|nr:tRNA:m(4)X modification enzyme TRM13 [Psidium guajava]